MLKELFRRFIAALKRLFGRKPRSLSERLGLTDSELASKLFSPEAKKRFKQAGPNMPKRQPCPRCGANSPRGAKTPGGAKYGCRTHGAFFVAASKRARRYA